MAFFTRQDIGRVYVIKMTLPDDTVVHKVGMCNSARSTDRMFEILRSWFNSYRFVPHAELRLDMQCHNPAKIESYIHKILRPVQFEPNHKVQGGTEMFTDIDEPRLIWFLKSCSSSSYDEFPELDKKQVIAMCELLTV